MTTRLVKIITEKLNVGMFGAAIQLDVTDETGAVSDLTTYGAIHIVAVSPDYITTREWTGTGDSVGNLSFTPNSDSSFDRPGMWKGQVEFMDSGTTPASLIMSPPFDMPVDPRLGT